MGHLIRQMGWEDRLAAAARLAYDRPYVLGEWDCLRFSCLCVEAITGVDLWPRFAGYKTKREALVTIARIAPSLSQAVTLVLGVMPCPPLCARRGDVVRYRDTEDHLGICLGREVAVLGPDGMLLLGLEHPGLVESWRVG